jgi:hypothetical protein
VEERVPPSGPALSIVVVVYDMARELPRTLKTLSPEYQRDIDPDEFEVIVVDNGSPAPLDQDLLAAFPGHLRTARIDPAPPSPASAANAGVRMARAPLVGLLIDGARMASPGLLATARLAARLSERAVITAPAWHLGPHAHMEALDEGYGQAVEDELLARSGWEENGYRLFSVSSLAGSSARGIFGPMGESNSLFMHRSLWDEVGGLEERFALPGGGLANHDLYRRACGSPGVELVVLLGEGTFHQFHGGAATSGRLTSDRMHAEYGAIRGERWRLTTIPPLFVGRLPEEAMPHVERSVSLAAAWEERRRMARRRAPRTGGRTPSN